MTKLTGDEPAFQANKHHLMTGTPTYSTWQSMIARCNRKSHVSYPEYGGRGIYVTPKWLVFAGFLDDMGIRPEDTTLDRIDNNGPYCKENCRWTTRSEQQKNRRQTRRASSYRGIAHKRGKWVAQAKFGGYNYFLGYFDDQDGAYFSYLMAVEWFRPDWIDALINKGASDER